MPDYDLAARLVETLPAPVILTGGLRTPEAVAAAYEHTGAAAVMLARGSLGDPWLFERVLGRREGGPGEDEVLAELQWVIDRAIEHLGEPRAARWMRKGLPVVCGAARSCAPGGQGDQRRPAANGVDPRGPRDLNGARAVAGPPPEAFTTHCTGLFWGVANLPARFDREPGMPREVILTPEGLEKLKSELDLLSGERRREIAARIKEAREFGDITENSEYDDAKNEQAMLEQRIAQLESACAPPR